jgi:hypothetical protein
MTDLESKKSTERDPAKEAAEVDKALDDPQFLKYLQKDPVAAEKAEDDDYLKEKIEMYAALKIAKETLKNFVSVEAGANLKNAVDESFMDALENISLRNPQEFLIFCAQASKYTESVKKMNALTEQRAKDEKTIETHNGSLETVEKNRPWDSRIPGFLLSARRKYTAQTKELNGKIAKLKESADSAATEIETIRAEIDGIKSGLQGNEGFELLSSVVINKARQRIAEAMQNGSHKALATEMSGFQERSEDGKNLFADEDYDVFLDGVREHMKGTFEASTEALVNKNESLRMSTYERAIDTLLEKGANLEIDEDECKERIANTLTRKIEELRASADPQATVKIILAKRMIKKLTS